MRDSLVKRYTVKSAKCNNVPVVLAEFDYEDGATLSVPIAAIDWETKRQVLELETTEGTLTFKLACTKVPASLRAHVDSVRCRIESSDAACPSMFRSTGNAKTERG